MSIYCKEEWEHPYQGIDCVRRSARRIRLSWIITRSKRRKSSSFRTKSSSLPFYFSLRASLPSMRVRDIWYRPFVPVRKYATSLTGTRQSKLEFQSSFNVRLGDSCTVLSLFPRWAIGQRTVRLLVGVLFMIFPIFQLMVGNRKDKPSHDRKS